MNQLPQEVEAAKQEAIAKGVPFSADYEPPYKLKKFSGLGKIWLDFSWENSSENPFFRTQGQYEETIPRWVYAVYCLENRFSGFFTSHKNAKSFCNAMNIRHFKVAGMSVNPKKPVLL